MQRSKLDTKTDERALLTAMHSSQHAGDESVNAITLLDLRNKRTDTTFVVCRAAKVSEDQFLKRVDLILQIHQVADGLVADIGGCDAR